MSTNPFIVKSITVQPANSSGMPPEMGNVPPPPMEPRGFDPRYQVDPRYQTMPPGYLPPGQLPQGMPAPAGRGGLQTVLKEQLLRITMEVEIVKLLPKS
jgi:hypothetical protein